MDAAHTEPYVRVATLSEIETISEIAGRAFIHDPVFNYFNNVDHLLDRDVDVTDCASREIFFTFMLKASLLVSGRVTVVVEPNENKIVACGIWFPPRHRLSIWKMSTLFRSGVISVLKRWGLTGLLRIVVDYQGNSEKVVKQYFKAKHKKGPIDDSWYLQLMFTDPEFHGRGYMSLLVREAFAHAPDAIFELEATTAKSRDQYAHFGFEDPTSIKFGSGKADGLGLTRRGEEAVGVEIWAMVKWPKPY